MASANGIFNRTQAVTRAAEWLRDMAIAMSRNPIGRSALVVAALFILLRGNPFQFYWSYIFEGLRIYAVWPLILLGGLTLFSLFGYFHHRSFGQAIYSPVRAFLAALLFVLILLDLLTAWAVDWPVWWCVASLFLMMLIALAINIGLISYWESWRSRCNEAVIRRVRDALEGAEFSDYLRGQSRPDWGSAHCLRIVEGHYAQTRENLLNNKDEKKLDSLLEDCFRAGETLLAYLDLRFAEEEGQKRRRKLIAQTAPEMAAICLWLADLRGARESVDYSRIEQWMTQLRDLGPDYQSHAAFLDFVFRLGQAPARPYEETVSRAMNLFEGDASGAEARKDLPEICADSWLAVSPAYMPRQKGRPDHLPRQISMDVWLAMREGQGRDVFVSRDGRDGIGIVKMWARRQLAGNYADWRDRTRKEWNQPLDERARQARQLVEQQGRGAGVWAPLEQETREIHSWPYLFVFQTPEVRRLLLTRSCLITALIALALIAVNPRLPFNWGWNTVDHVADRRAWHEYDDAETRAMADSQNLIALATDAGMVFIDKHSRVPRVRDEDGPALDVTRAPEPDAFLALADNGAITKWSPRAWRERAPWLPGPKDPVWPAASSGRPPPTALANHLDRDGWLVGVEGLGVARYRFGALGNGKAYRMRSWQQGDLFNTPLRRMQVTETGVWAALDNGVRYAARDTLKEDRGRRLDSSRIKQFDADYQGNYAAAVEENGNLWMYLPDGKGWNGPYFGRSGTPLRSAADVAVARLVGSTAWLGTSYGLFAYDLRRRQMHSVVQNAAISQIVAAATSPVVMAASDRGLFLLSHSGGVYSAKLLDAGRVDSLSLSPDASLCLYRRQSSESHGAYELRSLQSPFDKNSELLAGAQGWKPLQARDEVLAIKQLGQRTLFVTSAGSFLYDPAKRLYQDCSVSLFAHEADGKKKETEQPLLTFSDAVLETQQVLSVADDNPQVFSPGENKWRSLDPWRLTQPRQILGSTAGIFGLGRSGDIYRYEQFPTKPKSYLFGASGALQRQPLATNRVSGDLVLDGNAWKLALLHGGSATTYDSATGVVSEMSLPSADVTQARWNAGRWFYLLGSKRIVGERGEELFGGGSLPFAPESATMIARNRDGSITVGGPGGHIARYQWSNASWATVGPGPVPSGGAVETIRETYAGTVAQTSGAEFYLAGGQSWIRLPSYRRWAMGESTSGFWTFDQHSVIRYTPNTAGGEAQQRRFSGGAGIRAFTSSAAFIWQSDARTSVFFTNSARAGVYNSATDEWGEFQINGLSAPSRFFIAGGCVIALDGDEVLRISWINGALRADVLGGLPRNAAVRVDGVTLRMAFTESNDLKLRIWSNVCTGSYVEYSRSVARAPSEFDPSRVVYAEAEGPSTLLLVDQAGAAMIYDWVTGVWQLRRGAEPGQTVYGLVPGGGQKATMLVLETAQNTYLSVSLLKPPYGTIAVPINSPERSGLTRPSDGELLDENNIRIVRSSDWTGYAVRASDGWRTLRPRAGGFDEDTAQSVAISNTGQLWVLQMGQLSLFESVTDKGRLFLALTAQTVPLGWYPTTINEVLNHPRVAGLGLMQTGGGETMAAHDFGGRQLCWARRHDGSLDAFWRNASSGAREALRVWGSESCGDRLASQCVQDIAIADGRLLLSTELGLMERNPDTYALQSIHPRFRGARFVYADGGSRVLLKMGERIDYEWQAGGPTPAARREADSEVRIVSGPWVWRRTAQGAVSVFSERTGRPRRSRPAGGGWRFDDDIATALFRDQGLVIGTEDGFWTYDALRGRGDAASGPPNDAWSVSHPAVRIAYQGGNLSFHPFDGDSRPAFEQGRFFFDNAEQFCSLDDYLYTYVPGRGVFRRKADNPLVIDGAWPIPAGLAAGEEYILDTVSNRVRLRVRNRTVFVLDPGRENTQAWESAEISAERDENAVGPVVWRAEAGRRPRYEPFLASGGRTKLNRWWSGNRFAWDDISSAGLLDGANAVLITAAGPMAVTIDGSSLRTREIWPLPGVTHVGEAREDGRLIGLALRGETLFPQHLVTQNAGRLTRAVREGGASLLTESKLRVGFKDDASPGRHIGLSEEWQVGAGGALESGLDLSTGDLISDGRFVFDSVMIAAPLMSNGRPTGDWLAAAGCVNSSNCLVSLFTATSSASGPALRSFWSSAPCRFETLRPTASGGALGLCRTPGQPWRAYRLERQEGQLNYTEIETGDTGEAFRVGDLVRIDVRTMNWESKSPHYVWDRRALEVAPQGYQLFTAARNGFTLSFDRMNSLALDAGGATLAVGTDGGLFLWPYRSGGPHLFALGQTGGQFIFNQRGRPENWVLGVTRLRHDAGGNLLMKYRPENYVARLDTAGRLNTRVAGDWWTHFIPSGEIRLDQEGFVVRGERYTESNDAWSLGRKKITGIVDFAFERDMGVLWIATRNQGVFKVLTNHLGRQ